MTYEEYWNLARKVMTCEDLERYIWATENYTTAQLEFNKKEADLYDFIMKKLEQKYQLNPDLMAN